MRARPRLAATAACVACLAGPLGGCGSSSGNGVAAKTPEAIVAASKAAAEGAKSVHVSGTIVSNGAPIALDLQLTSSAGRGRLSLGGLGFELIQTGGTVYIKGSEAFYRHIGGAAAAQLLQGRWLKASATTPEFASLSRLADLRGLIDASLEHHGALAKTGTTRVNGQAVVGVSDQSKGGTLYVATTGKPYPVQISRTGGGGGAVNFDAWNEPVTITPPANALDITQLRGAH
jgi:hypothetical protein